jgi:adenine-specific DNA-methyltransferase
MQIKSQEKKKLTDCSQEELIEIINHLRKRKKYGLVWEDKPEKVVEKCKQELPVLDQDESLSIEKNPQGITNLMIEGDNYHALSVLNYTHSRKIDLIYIDPPYNTGSKDFIYNDSYVDKEDRFRHSKWLSFLSKRLILSKNLLKSNGYIAISIDDNEYAQLKPEAPWEIPTKRPKPHWPMNGNIQ